MRRATYFLWRQVATQAERQTATISLWMQYSTLLYHLYVQVRRVHRVAPQVCFAVVIPSMQIHKSISPWAELKINADMRQACG